MKLKGALNIVFERVIGPNTVDSADMEGMGGGGCLLVKSSPSGNTYALDKTWKEIKDAFASGKNVVIDRSAEMFDDGIEFDSVYIVGYNGSYYVATGNTDYSADSENGYPTSGGAE